MTLFALSLEHHYLCQREDVVELYPKCLGPQSQSRRTFKICRSAKVFFDAVGLERDQVEVSTSLFHSLNECVTYLTP